jgi:hypothetical protein
LKSYQRNVKSYIDETCDQKKQNEVMNLVQPTIDIMQNIGLNYTYIHYNDASDTVISKKVLQEIDRLKKVKKLQGEVDQFYETIQFGDTIGL